MKNMKVKIMPCLDIKEGRVVKGVHFASLKDAGDPVAVAQAYVKEGADELAFLDITATVEGRPTNLETVTRVVEAINIPITVGGGINTLETAREVLSAGASRISISSAAVRDPNFINTLADEFSPDRIVVAIDVDHSDNTPSGYEVYIDGGSMATRIDAIVWAKEVAQRGAGIILPTSKACDGVKEGYDLPLIKKLREAIDLPIIASGGAGQLHHFLQAAQAGANILLAASVFHFGLINIPELKRYLKENNILLANDGKAQA